MMERAFPNNPAPAKRVRQDMETSALLLHKQRANHKFHHLAIEMTNTAVPSLVWRYDCPSVP
jgi:hypothetical protein